MEQNADLQDLVDNPRETMECEVKSWLDLTEKVQQAKLAKHIAALSNHGGGYIVIGFNDDLSPSNPVPASLDPYDRDVVGGIIKKYLSPLVECRVDLVESSLSKRTYPVISVSGHGSVPICTIADGPSDDKGRPQGIKNSTYYIRSAKPESVEILRHEDWQPLIQRCVMREKDGLLRGIAAIMKGVPSPTSHESLKQWQDRVLMVFLERVKELPRDTWAVPLEDNHCQLSFRMLQDDGQSVQIGKLRNSLLQIHEEVKRFIETGWGCFFPVDRDDLSPKIFPDLIDGAEVDILESNLLHEFMSIREFWRLSSNGWGSLVRSYLTDVDPSKNFGFAVEPGTTFPPNWAVLEAMEFVKTARAFSAYFATAHSIELRVAYRGLKGRYLKDGASPILFSSNKSNSPSRESSLIVSIAEFDADPFSVIASLLRPIFVLFNGYELTPKWVEQQTARSRGR